MRVAGLLGTRLQLEGELRVMMVIRREKVMVMEMALYERAEG